MIISFVGRISVAAVLAIAIVSLCEQSSLAQARPAASPSHVVIPFLANDSKPTDLEFEGAECDLSAVGDQMTCVFQQVFLTTTPIAPDTCLVTTNRYQRTFRRDAPTHWTSREGPDGVCGIVDVATLQDDGDVRWTMDLRKEVTNKDAAPSCQTVDPQSITFGWRDLRRPLPCRFLQPGALTP
jgi:hypothetical protein